MDSLLIKSLKCILSDDADFAEKINGVGYRKGDGAKVAKHIAMYEEYGRLSTRQLNDLWKTLRTYKIQLINNWGINFDDIPEPKIDRKKDAEIIAEQALFARNKSAHLSGTLLNLKFDYNPNAISLVKSTIKGVQWDPVNKAWTVLVDSYSLPEIADFAEKFKLDISHIMNEMIKIAGENKTNLRNRPAKNVIFDKDAAVAIINFPYDRKIVDEVKRIFSRKFDPVNKCWKVDISESSGKDLISFINKYDFYVDVEDKDYIQNILDRNRREEIEKFKAQQTNIEDSQAHDADVEVKGLKKVLRPFQKAGVKYLTANKKVILGDDMGLGKTIQSLATVHHVNSYPCLTVCPDTLKYNWHREWNSWVDKNVKILHSNSDPKEILTDDVDVVVCNFSTQRKFEKELIAFKFKSFILDESHSFKNEKALRTISINNIINCSNAEYVLELTGTVVTNRPYELISQLKIINRLESDFGGFWNFVNRYCDPQNNGYGYSFKGATNIPELHEKLRKTCYIRREAQEVLDELPERESTVITLDITNRAQYSKAERNLISHIQELNTTDEELKIYLKEINPKITAKNVDEHFASLDRDQVKGSYLAYKQDKAEKAEHLVTINELRKISAQGKYKQIIEWTENFLESGRKLILFGIHKDLIKKVAAHFDCNYITGDVPTMQRQEIVDDFQENPDTKLLVMNINTGGLGLTLTAASDLAFMEFEWTPGQMDQAAARIYRMGQKNHCNMYYLVGLDTIDLDFIDLVDAKREVTDGINKGKEVQDFDMIGVLLQKLLDKENK